MTLNSVNSPQPVVCSAFISTLPISIPAPTPDDIFKQIDYIAELVGIDHIALGVDFFPTEGVWRDLQIAQGAANLRWAVKDMSEMPKITQCLVEHGYSEVDIHKVLGGNFLRVCQEVFGQ